MDVLIEGCVWTPQMAKEKLKIEKKRAVNDGYQEWIKLAKRERLRLEEKIEKDREEQQKRHELREAETNKKIETFKKIAEVNISWIRRWINAEKISKNGHKNIFDMLDLYRATYQWRLDNYDESEKQAVKLTKTIDEMKLKHPEERFNALVYAHELASKQAELNEKFVEDLKCQQAKRQDDYNKELEEKKKTLLDLQKELTTVNHELEKLNNEDNQLKNDIDNLKKQKAELMENDDTESNDSYKLPKYAHYIKNPNLYRVPAPSFNKRTSESRVDSSFERLFAKRFKTISTNIPISSKPLFDTSNANKTTRFVAKSSSSSSQNLLRGSQEKSSLNEPQKTSLIPSSSGNALKKSSLIPSASPSSLIPLSQNVLNKPQKTSPLIPSSSGNALNKPQKTSSLIPSSSPSSLIPSSSENALKKSQDKHSFIPSSSGNALKKSSLIPSSSSSSLFSSASQSTVQSSKRKSPEAAKSSIPSKQTRVEQTHSSSSSVDSILEKIDEQQSEEKQNVIVSEPMPLVEPVSTNIQKKNEIQSETTSSIALEKPTRNSDQTIESSEPNQTTNDENDLTDYDYQTIASETNESFKGIDDFVSLADPSLDGDNDRAHIELDDFNNENDQNNANIGDDDFFTSTKSKKNNPFDSMF